MFVTKNGRWLHGVKPFLAREKEVLLAFFASRLLVWILGWLAFYWIKHGDYKIFTGGEPWNLLYHWDSFWYARIVAHGYSYTAGEQSSVAFFPLLPLCIYTLRALTGMGTALAGFLISNTALLTAAVLLRRLVALDFPPPSRVPERTVWLLLLCPMTFFHSAIYTESLFLMLSVAALLCARKRFWAGAGLAGAFLTACRANGIVILIPLLWEAFTTRQDSEAAGKGIFRTPWWLLIVPSGLVAFATYLCFKFGDVFAFSRAQGVFHREIASPWEGIEIASRYPVPYGHFFIGTFIVALVLCFLGYWKRIRLSYQFYALAMLIFCVSMTLWESLPRYLSVVFPFYIALVAATIRSEALYIMALAASTGLMTVCLILFVCGYFMT